MGMSLLSLVVSLVIFVVIYGFVSKKIGLSDKDSNVMFGGYFLLSAISSITGLAVALIKGAFLAAVPGALITFLLMGAFSYYFFKKAGYNLLDIFEK